MKRFWHTFLAIVVTATMANTANAQSGSTGEIGSYQSILSRSGYGDSAASTGVQAPAPTGPGSAITYGTGASCANGNCAGDQGTGSATTSIPAGTPIGGATYGGQVGTNPSAYGAYGYSSSYATPGSQIMSVPQQSVLQAPIQGGIVQGTPVHSNVTSYAGSVEGGAVIDQGYVGNSTSPIINYTQPTVSQPTYGPSTWSQPVVSQPVISQPTFSQPVYSAPVYAQPTYQTVPVYVAGESFTPRRSSNLVFGIFGVNLRRDYEHGIKLGYTPQGNFFSDDVRNGNLLGGGVSLTNRNSGGTGWEIRYWGVDESDRQDFGPGTSGLRGLDDVSYSPATNSAKFVFDNAENLSVARSSRINSLALNLLRNGGRYQTHFGRCGNYEMLAGFRIFNFDEDFSYAANNSATAPSSLTYGLEADNLLTGFQVGGRNEVCLNDRLRLAKGFNVGIFNNRIDTRQRIFDGNGTDATIGSGVYAGTPFNFEDEKDDVAFLGEINIGLIWQLSRKARLNVGYKALGVAGVALAADQIPRDFTDIHALQSANSNGSLLSHGSYFGAEFSF